MIASIAICVVKLTPRCGTTASGIAPQPSENAYLLFDDAVPEPSAIQARLNWSNNTVAMNIA